MHEPHRTDPMTRRLIDTLYVEAMVLADEARAYFDEHGRADRERLAPIDRVAFSCESLKVTTRLMHVIAWLLTRKAIHAGEIEGAAAGRESMRLGMAEVTEGAVSQSMPEQARTLIDTSMDLYARVSRIDRDLDIGTPAASPARGLLNRLERAF